MSTLYRILTITVMVSLMWTTSTFAANYFWNDSTGTVDDYAKWVDETGAVHTVVPGTNTGDVIYIKNSGTATISADHTFAGNITSLFVGDGSTDGPTSSPGAGHVVQTGGTVTVDGARLYIGKEYEGSYTLSGGLLDSTNWWSAVGDGAAGTFTISGDGQYHTNARMYIGYHENGNGTLAMSGNAEVDTGSRMYIADGINSVGLVTMTDNASILMPGTSGRTYIASQDGASGTVTMSGQSTMIVNSDDGLRVGSGTSGTTAYANTAVGTINLSGGDSETAGAKMTVTNNASFAVWACSQGNLNVHDYAEFEVGGTLYLGDNSNSNLTSDTGEGNILVDGHGKLTVGGLHTGNFAHGVGNVTLSNNAVLTSSGYCEFGRRGGVASFTMNNDSRFYGTSGRLGGTVYNGNGGYVDFQMNGNSRIEFSSFVNLGEEQSTCDFEMNTAASIQANSFDLGYDAGAVCNGTINDACSITTNSTVNVGVFGATALVNFNGTSTLSVGGNLRVGHDYAEKGDPVVVTTSNGTLNMNGSSSLTINGGDTSEDETASTVGYDQGVGHLNLRGSSTTTATNGSIFVGAYNGTGYVTVSDNAQATLEDIQIGVNWQDDIANLGIGTVTVDGAGAVVTVVGAGTHINDYKIVEEAQVGSEFQNTITIGAAGGQGTWNQDAGQTICSNVVILGEYDYYNWDTVYTPGEGTLNLNGGTFACAGISTRSDSAVITGTSGTINFDGGVLKATANSTDFVSVDDAAAATMTLNVKSGGAVIDTDEFNVDILQPLLEDTSSTGGGLTKRGAGELTLDGGANTYTGDTTVEDGTLTITSNNMLSDVGDLSIAAGAYVNLDFTGSADVIGALYLDGIAKAIGTWGSSISGATHVDDTYFTGTGMVMVGFTLIPGDTNYDMIVDETDAAMVASNWNSPTTAGPSAGDFNSDGVVDATDASIMAANWGNHTESAGEGAVPEPSTVIMLLIGIVTLMSRRRR